VEFAAYRPSGVWDFEAGARFLENLCILALETDFQYLVFLTALDKMSWRLE
jgi:hypothetical protein